MRRLLLPIVLTGALWQPPAALGQGDGVTVDPDSPTGREYAIPLEEARREAGAGGRPDRVEPGERSAELFGAGVGDSGGPSAGAEREGGAAREPASGGGAGADAGASPDVERVREPEAGVDAQRSSAGSRDVLLVGGIGLGVLVLGASAGVLVRRRLTGT